MPQHERGLYEPGEDARVFDGAEDEEDVEGSRLPLLIVLALLVLAMFAGFVWLAYSEGVARGRGETPVVTAEAGPARVAPQNAGGAAEPYKGFKVYEQPAPPDDDTAQNSVAAQHAAPGAKPTPVAATSAAAAPAAKAEAASAPAKIATTIPATKPSLAAKNAPSQPSAPVGPATAPPRALNAAPAPAIPVPAPAAAAPEAGGSYVLQIGAYKSQADADTAWTTYKAKHASLLAGYSPDVRQADLGEKGIWYRLRIAGFPSKDVASALCDRLKADGGGCFLGK
jgi:cell division septation protein DedD